MQTLKTILLICCLSATASAQVTDSSSALFSLGVKVHRSFIIQHTAKLSDAITSSHPWMVEADLSWHLRKRNTWEYCHCYPRTGISLLYTNFDMPDVLGSALSAYAFIDPYIAAHHRMNFSIRFGLGPVYLTRVYDAEENPDNLFFSAPVSFVVLLNTNANYRLTSTLTLRATGSYNHISNGGYSEPNLGMNFPSLALGIDYSFQEIVLPRREPSATSAIRPRKHRFDVVAGLSAKPVTSGIDEKKYPVYVVGVNYSRAITHILALNGGAEWVNDRSIYKSLRLDNAVNNNGSYPDHNRVALLVGIDWLFGRFIFYQHAGFYVYSPVEAMNKWYQRYGLNFMITEHLFFGINIKAHGQDADFMDVRAGWAF